ncbi:hypothetical protein W97_05926 [Coniosporium apollinis CBS 100218]|uniref:DNA-directed RNA polymerase RBP11-like dimerisation domain-containing protein n=1 Tax=Coniosporium apollinis (strain CBS 100218) TaxID=1168221 RepID=R7YXM0_CONA1|nr:uncharacterized protein W97_05926 [Coniosporium apollinis CBS 100218]EON66680.1 hypothetical protein W97_05926 [Coniosporium apollinis CBS 100218]
MNYPLGADPRDRNIIRYGRSGAGTNTSANYPERYELFILGDGEKKVTWVLDTRVPNTAIFTFNKEDHTLGNLLASRLHKYPHVQFSAYKVPHPLFATFDLRVTTDGSMTPKAAVAKACADLVTDLGKLSQEFTKEWELKRLANSGRE